jgi:hypothetical protein
LQFHDAGIGQVIDVLQPRHTRNIRARTGVDEDSFTLEKLPSMLLKRWFCY